jgi:predicted dehydrogenase
MSVPDGFNYEMWLGETPYVYYTVDRVHPPKGYDRPGWLRCRQFGAGMITGWGAHHIDSAHWGMNTEYTGPVEIWGHAEFPDHGLWDVHGPFKTEAVYAPNDVSSSGVHMSVSGDYPNGIKFYGTKGWIFVSRGNESVTKSDPVAKLNDATALAASDPAMIKSVIGPEEIHLYESKDQHGNWLDCIITRQAPISPAEMGHRACSTCLLHDMAMVLKRKLQWDPTMERFRNDDEANGMLSRPQRSPYRLA